jgi:excisionase family DNA binding protein
MDLLLLGALACQAPVAVLSVPLPDGRWNTLTYGMDTREGVNDGRLYELFAATSEALEVPDLVTAVPRSPLVQPPHSMRWAYGVTLRDDAGGVLGVTAVLDRWLRQLTKREQRAVASMGRQLAVHLAELRRRAAGGADPAGGRDAPADPTDYAAKATPSRSSAETSGLSPATSLDPALVRSGDSGEAADRSVPLVYRPGGPGGGRDLRGRRPVTGPPAGAGGAVAGERHPLLRSQEVAELFDVTERTVINWAAAGKLPCLRTIGGHLRFRRDDVMRLLSGSAS